MYNGVVTGGARQEVSAQGPAGCSSAPAIIHLLLHVYGFQMLHYNLADPIHIRSRLVQKIWEIIPLISFRCVFSAN